MNHVNNFESIEQVVDEIAFALATLSARVFELLNGNDLSVLYEISGDS